MKGKVLITEVVHPVLKTELTGFGFTCNHFEKITYEEVQQIIGDYTGLVVRSKIKADRQLIDKGKTLKFIARTGSGMELIDVPFASQKGITCFNSPEGNRDSVAEHATGMVLSLLHNINKSHAELKNGIWSRIENTGSELSGKTVGIIGFGNTGSAFAKRMKAFEVNILAYDKYKFGFSEHGVKECNLNQIFELAEIVSLHIPLTNETHAMINSNFISQFKRPIYLVNTSRGGIAKTDDLLTALQKGQLKGLAIDVFENEDLNTYQHEDYRLLVELGKCKNVIMTPHIAGVTHESTYKIAYVLAKKIIEHYTVSNNC
ncbi:MAG: hydroxyacid dehydrogenase [Sphingobacteriales bacterium]|nr:MAG: hydroxyacid dehydrogenase [Sphingobacteriales bacterium]